jgi:methyl-accepting chemotaxis protein
MFRNMKVGTRLILCFLAVALLGAIVAGIGITKMDQMNEGAKRLYLKEMLGLSYTKEANIDLIYVGRALRGAMLAPSEAQREESFAHVEKYKKAMQDNLDKARPLFYTDEGKRAFADMDAQLREYEHHIAELTKQIKAEPINAQRASVDYLYNTFTAPSNAIDDKLSQLARFKEERARAGNLENKGRYESGRSLMVILVVCTGITGVALGLLITRSLTRQLGGEPAYAAEVAGRIAAGDLATEVRLRSGDDSSLLAAMHAMRDKLAVIVTQVRGGTDAIAAASGQIASGNQDLSSRTEEQASSLEETASSMEELTSTVKQNADNARQANALAITASEVAGKGGAVVAQVVETMGSIKDSSAKVVDIIAVIDGIAFQTNILALNAAVEAARAGEQGRGFAVVAGEVRTLAHRSAAAAKEIKQLIGDSVGKVESGSQLVGEAGMTMREVVTSIQRVADIMAEITSASQEQTAGIEQINQAVSQMDNVTQQNAGLVEEAAAASEAMQNQAAKLSGLVSLFRLDAGQVRAEPVVQARAATPRPAPSQVRTLAKPQAAPLPPAAKPAVRPPAKAKGAAGAGDWEEF